jgi:hypothetical protein
MFYMLICCLYIFFVDVSVKLFGPIFYLAVCILIVEFMNALYILGKFTLFCFIDIFVFSTAFITLS